MTEENQIINKKKKKKNKFKTALGTITILGGIGLATYSMKESKNIFPIIIATSLA